MINSSLALGLENQKKQITTHYLSRKGRSVLNVIDIRSLDILSVA